MMPLIPDPVETEEQYRRFYHQDIASLDDTDIIDEVHALHPLLWWKLPGNDWLRQRTEVLQAEARKRGLTWR
jgi:hypothetical protein